MSPGAVLESAGDAPAAPEWLGEPAEPPRGRVVRAADAPFRPVELPRAEELFEQADTSATDDGGDDAASASAVAWALAHRRGLAEGRAAGWERGLEEGRRAGHEQALREAAERHEAVLQELGRAADRHVAELEATTAALAAQATELAFAIAQAVVGRELTLSRDPGADAVRRAVAAVGGTTEAVARLHPDDLGRLSVPPAELAPGGSLRLVPDDTLTPGDCVLESGAASVDAGIGAAMARVRVALGLERAMTDGENR